MVDTESYRWICNVTYSLVPEPIRSHRTFELQAETNADNDSTVLFYCVEIN